MKVKTADLIGPALDWAVAQLEGKIYGYKHQLVDDCRDVIPYTPSTDWSQGGPIIERREIELHNGSLDRWCAKDTNYQFLNTPQQRPVFAQGYGHTPLIAAMRCYVLSKLGEEVEVPDELCK